jgi:soluble lytic murein transglycosylase-like protein
MVAAGFDRSAASDYLDRQYAVLEARHRPAAQPPVMLAVAPVPTFTGPFDVLIEKYAGLHQVQASLVRAIIATESAFNPLARSRAGAIGLMQLMPGTAMELGVNPLEPEQNIEGGVRYFSQLLKMFGGVEMALVAYNAGPGFAQRYARGQAVLYGETRDYVRSVLGRLQASTR